jgi:hypothetical protein
MGRGRRGILEQSQKKPKISPVARKNQPLSCIIGDKKIPHTFSFPWEFIEKCQKMDHKAFAQALLQN